MRMNKYLSQCAHQMRNLSLWTLTCDGIKRIAEDLDVMRQTLKDQLTTAEKSADLKFDSKDMIG